MEWIELDKIDKYDKYDKYNPELEIYKYFKQGYSNREIHELKVIYNQRGQLMTMRGIQMHRKEWDEYCGGRMDSMSLFTYHELYAVSEDPTLLLSIMRRAAKRYYKSLKPREPTNRIAWLYNLRLQVIENGGYKCAECDAVFNLEAHHFRNKGSTDPEDCICLCRSCHMKREEHL